MKLKNRILSLSALSAALLPLAAAAHSYSYLEGGYLSVDTGREDDAGLRIAGAGPLTPPLVMFGEYADTGDLEQFTVGLMFRTPLDNQVDLNLGGSVENVDTGRVDDNGMGLRAGLRWQVQANRFELNPEIRYMDVFNQESTSLRLASLLRLHQAMDLQAAVQGGDDDRFELGLRYNFGPRMTGM